MVARPSPPGGMTRSVGIRPAPPFTGGRGFNWERATLDPYGYRGGAYGPLGFANPLGMGGAAFGPRVIVEDVYDDDNVDIGCEGEMVQAVGSLADLSEPKSSEPRLGHEAKVNFGHEVSMSAASGPVKCTFGQDGGFGHHHRRHHHGGMMGGYGGQYGGMGSGAGYIPPPAPPPVRPSAPPPSAPLPPPPPPPSFGQEARFGWMMPTLPGAISESPLRGVFAPDVSLTGSMGLGGLG
jgi:hypothetical protein